jgi:caffeoyl-CoA O-methyltransferase
MSDSKTLGLSSELHDYLVAHGTPPDSIQRELIEETREKIGGLAIMQIAPEQGSFMTLLTKLLGARNAIEVGTFTGYSALCIARGLPDNGRLLCCDVSDEYAQIGLPYWEKAGVAHKIDLKIAPALETLRALPEERTIDLSFVDADKTNYANYYEELLKRTRPGGVILIDNVLWAGAVVDPERDDENTVAIRAFNDFVTGDDRVDCVMLSISDGLTLLRVKDGD